MQLTPQEAAGQLILLAQEQLAELGFRPAIHFELEGTIKPTHPHPFPHLDKINDCLVKLGIQGELQAEFWPGQWEYVSKFAGQTPLEEANFLAQTMRELPRLFQQFGASSTEFSPVTWSATTGRMVGGSRQIFSTSTAPVHIPNAIQVNVSLLDSQNSNLFAEGLLAELVQQHLLETSYHCCLLFLPEEDAYKRLALRQSYGLDQELSSPFDISGGHQGSIALYRDKGKHNQRLGIQPLLFSCNGDVLLEHCNWQAQARVEHRLGATSLKYCPWLNVLYMLLNLLDAVADWQKLSYSEQQQRLTGVASDKQTLPSSLRKTDSTMALTDTAIHRFEQQTWFAQRVNQLVAYSSSTNELCGIQNVGAWLHQAVLSKYFEEVQLIELGN